MKIMTMIIRILKIKNMTKPIKDEKYSCSYWQTIHVNKHLLRAHVVVKLQNIELIGLENQRLVRFKYGYCCGSIVRQEHNCKTIDMAAVYLEIQSKRGYLLQQYRKTINIGRVQSPIQVGIPSTTIQKNSKHRASGDTCCNNTREQETLGVYEVQSKRCNKTGEK